MPDIRLAVSGLADAGKTVFITQLVSHLEHFKRGRFDLGDGRTITDVKLAAVEVPGVNPFPYQEARNHLLGRASHWPPATREPDPDWPPATREVTGLRVEFTLIDESAWFFTRSRYHVEMYDFPGELLVDLNLPDRSFAAWSEDTLRRLRDPVSPLQAAGVKYLPLLDNLQGLEPEMLVRGYHDALEAAMRHGARSVTPAAWIYTRGAAAKTIPIHFAPLPANAPKRLHDVFSQSFESYTKWLAPLVNVFCRCDRHVILVDVLEILRAGQARYVERKATLQELIQFYARAHGFLERLVRDLATTMRIPIQPSRMPLSKAIVVATKADAIVEEDRGRLAGLLQEMLESEFKSLDTAIDFRACAAYDATRRATDGQRWVIIGRVPSAPQQAQPREVARVPESWPDYAWDGSEFRSFRHYLPPIPDGPIRDDATFPHINLNEIFRELLDLTRDGRPKRYPTMDLSDRDIAQRSHRPGDPLEDLRSLEDAQLDNAPVSDFTPLTVAHAQLPTVSSERTQRRARMKLVRNLAVIVLLLVCALSLITVEVIDLVRRMEALLPGFGWVLSGGAMILLLLLTWTIVASIVEYARVRRNLLSQPIDVLALQRDVGLDWATLRSTRVQLQHELARLGIDLAPADLAELRAVQAELHTWPADNTRQWLLRYDGDVLAVIDRAVADRVRKEAVSIAVLTSLSPRGGLDVLLVMWRQFRLIRTIAVLYGWRPGFFGTLILIRSVLTNAALAAGLNEVGDLAVEMLGSGISAYAGGLIGEAIGNAALTLRLARRTVDACRPLRNRQAPPYRVTLLHVALEVRNLRRQRERDPITNQAQAAEPSEALEIRP